MPSSATLLGTTLHQQFVPLEFDALFNLVGGAAHARGVGAVEQVIIHPRP
jgi:hypothetical protein